MICHMQTAIDDAARADAQHWRMNVATNAAAGENLDPPRGFNAAEKLAMDFDFSDFDVGVYNSVLADNQSIAGRNRTLKIPVNAQASGELELAGNICSLVE